MGFMSALFSYGGELGNYTTCAVDGIINSPQGIQALEAYKELYSFTPPGWVNAANVRKPGDHRRFGRHEHELLRLLSSAAQTRRSTRTPPRPVSLPARPARTASGSRRSAAKAFRSSRIRRSRRKPESS